MMRTMRAAARAALLAGALAAGCGNAAKDADRAFDAGSAAMGRGDLPRAVAEFTKTAGALDSAESYYLEAVAASHRAENLQTEAAALNNLGVLARERHDTEKAGD